jgi:hypothetical protein
MLTLEERVKTIRISLCKTCYKCEKCREYRDTQEECKDYTSKRPSSPICIPKRRRW